MNDQDNKRITFTRRLKLFLFLFCLRMVFYINAAGADELISLVSKYYYEGEIDRAISQLKDAQKSLDKEKFLNLALLYKKKHDYHTAASVYNEIIAVIPDEREAIFGLGQCYFFSAEVNRAIDYFETLVMLNPNDCEAIYYRGWCYEENADFSQALACYQKVLAKEPEHIECIFRMAAVCERLGDYAEAEKYYLKIKSFDSSWTGIYERLAFVYAKERKREEQFKALSKLSAIEPENLLWKRKLADVREQLGKDYFAKLSRKKSEERKFSPIVVPISSKDIPLVDVCISRGVFAVSFKCSKGFNIIGTKNDCIYNMPDTEDRVFTLTLNATDNKIKLINKDGKLLTEFNSEICIVTRDARGTITVFDLIQGSGEFWAHHADRDYRGQLKVRINHDTLTLINRLNLEEYLYGVVPAEMPAAWPKEALKAQAILARTQAIFGNKLHEKQGYNFCSDVHCQAYRGVSVETEATNKAVDETKGLIAVYQSNPIEAIYSNNCGGHTQNNIFGAKTDIPYLQGRVDLLKFSQFKTRLSPLRLEKWLMMPQEQVLCRNTPSLQASSFRWRRVYTRNDLSKIINRNYKIGKVKDIVFLKREKSLHLSKIKIIGTKGEQVVEGELNIRKVLGGLRSSMFDFWLKYDRLKTPELFIFYGGGWGHGVGMCQNGARALAENNYKSDFILKFYFQDVEIKKIY
ncbi:MAG: SpoIID/LytB domain-containing protein [Candidatus Omnitrophota bacterium]